MERTNQMLQFEPHFAATRQVIQTSDSLCVPATTAVGKFYPFIKQQGFDATFGGSQLLHLRITQLHQMPQLTVAPARYVNAIRFSTAQAQRKISAVEPIGFHTLTSFARHHRRRHYQTRMIACHQLVMQTKTGGTSFINKSNSFSAKMFVHVIEQMRRTIGQPQRLKQGGVISKGGGHALLINVQPREDLELRGNNPQSGDARCHVSVPPTS